MTLLEEAETPALLVQAQQGDGSAFCELCRLTGPRLVRQATALCGDPQLAEDLAQDTLVAAWKSLHRYNGKCRFFTWLCSILIHLHKSNLRRNCPSTYLAGTPEVTDGTRDPLESIVDTAAVPDQAAVSSERAALLHHCLESLPPKHRDVVFLRFYVNESLEGIAVALNCSLGTVKSRLFHALEKLRKIKRLTDEYPHNPGVS
jgi:RNA polymerase sigma-70 factor (ECF subfamily)